MALTRVGTNVIADSGVKSVDIGANEIGLRELNIAGSYVDGSVIGVNEIGDLVFHFPSSSTLASLTDVDVVDAVVGDVLVYTADGWIAQAPGALSSFSLTNATDVDLTSVINGQFLTFNGTSWINKTVKLNDLSDVVSNVATSGQVLMYNGADWVADNIVQGEINTASNIPGGVGIFATKTGPNLLFKSLKAGANLTFDSDGSFVTFAVSGLATVATTGSFLDLTNAPVVPVTVADLSDVADTSAVTGDVLRWNGTEWAPAANPGTVSTLNDLSDVTLVSSQPNQYLKFTGATWVNSVISYNELVNRPVLANVAITGSYNDLAVKPSIPASIHDLTDVDTSGKAANDILRWNGTYWVASQEMSAGGGEANTASSIGPGVGLYASKSGPDLKFKSLVAGANIQLTSNADNVVISSQNASTVEKIVFQKSNDQLVFVSKTAGVGSVAITDISAGQVNFAFDSSYKNAPASTSVYGQKSAGSKFELVENSMISMHINDSGTFSSPALINPALGISTSTISMQINPVFADDNGYIVVQFLMAG